MTAYKDGFILMSLICACLLAFVGYFIYQVQKLQDFIAKEKDKFVFLTNDIKISAKVLNNNVYIYVNDIQWTIIDLKELK